MNLLKQIFKSPSEPIINYNQTIQDRKHMINCILDSISLTERKEYEQLKTRREKIKYLVDKII